MRKNDKSKTEHNIIGSVGLLPPHEVQFMLDAFGKMSLHDQAAIFCVIRARAQDNECKSRRAA